MVTTTNRRQNADNHKQGTKWRQLQIGDKMQTTTNRRQNADNYKQETKCRQPQIGDKMKTITNRGQIGDKQIFRSQTKTWKQTGDRKPAI